VSARYFGSYSVELDNEDKVFFPEEGITKGDVIRYYQRVGKDMLKHLRDRPLTLQRFPDGIGEEGFYQKKVPEHFPGWIQRVKVDLENGDVQEQTVANKKATLVYLANQGVITPHVWLSRTDELRQPDRLVFDLDPSGDDFRVVRQAARMLQRLLSKLGLAPFVMTTGSSGAHVWAPLRRGPEFREVRAFAEEVADCLAQAFPGEFTTETRKDRREGRLFLDVGRNAYGQTAVAPYALRPLPGAPAAVPLDWEELDRSDLGPRSFTLNNVPRRLSQKDDPWAGMGRRRASLAGAKKKLAELHPDVCKEAVEA